MINQNIIDNRLTVAYVHKICKHGDDVTLILIFCAGHVDIYQINLLWSKMETKMI